MVVLKLSVPDKMQLVVHHKNSEYEIMICAASAAAYNLNIQVLSVGQYVSVNYCRQPHQSIVDFLTEISQQAKLKMLEIAMCDRETLRIGNPHVANN